MTTYRPAQEAILAYRRGRMGVAAVPGSGKTWTLSHLAAQIVASGAMADDQEVLVVTLVNSAVDNFYRRVSALVQGRGLLPYLGYRVRTLHGLAHDIVRERPGLAGLDDRFQIIDERETNVILDEACQAWLRSHPFDLDDYFDPDLEDNRRDWARREPLPDLVRQIALEVMRQAKDLRLTPERLRARLDELPVPLPLAEMGWQIYADYQRSLTYRGGVDFDDLIRLALQALENDPDFLARLRQRWPYILEDEAQDSSRLQEQILELLAGPHGNWVRVGDPNQAIYETFTTASPHFLRDFMRRPGVSARPMPNSGRSAPGIIWLANALVEWTMANHPTEAARDALHAPPWIEPAPPGDPQPNPPDEPGGIRLALRKYTPADEIQAVADSLGRWLPEHPDWTVAVLAPRSQRGFDLGDELKRRGIPYADNLLRSSSQTRLSAGALGNLLRFLADPDSSRKLAVAYQVWRRADRDDERLKAEVDRHTERLRKLGRVEDFLWPGPEFDALDELQALDRETGEDDAAERLAEFREVARRWQKAVLLPVDQLALTLAQDLMSEPAELALAHKLAVLLRQASQSHPTWRLPELSEELVVIARNERRFIGVSPDDSGFDPDAYRGKVVLATVHKAKGLEWDRVYLMSVNNYDFPSGSAADEYQDEKWFLRDHLNLPAEALAQLEAALGGSEYNWYTEGTASQAARLDYIRERLRLLYVGITRARRELVVSWNSGRRSNLLPALAFQELARLWEAHHHAS